MKIFVFTTLAIAALSAVEAFEQASVHLRVHEKTSCTITNESQCNGQNWTGSTCCADSSYECRWSDDGQNVQRCQKKKSSGTPGAPAGAGTKPATPSGGGGTVGDWGDCNGGKKCQNPSSVCVKHSNYYSQCKPATLPAGALCGQNDGTNVWKYEKCPSNQKCAAMGSDFRCSNKKHHKKVAQKGGYCTITNESQCNGQNWTGSTCCADSRYECRWSDDGQNVQRCQKKKWKKQHKKVAQKTDSVTDYPVDDDDDTADDYNDVADADNDATDAYNDATDDYDDATDDYDDAGDDDSDDSDSTSDSDDGDYNDATDDYTDSPDDADKGDYRA